jgi:hypothetical protein|tara:strand:- start:258 stop:374 length:117 start_codon:yes stop_codon:yes gene_type:complete
MGYLSIMASSAAHSEQLSFTVLLGVMAVNQAGSDVRDT